MTNSILSALAPLTGYKSESAQLRLLELLFDSTLTCVAVLDNQCKFIHVNEAFGRAARGTVAGIIGCNYRDLLAPAAEPIFAEAVRTGMPTTGRSRLFGDADDLEAPARDWEWRLVPVLNAGGDIDLLILSVSDLTIQTSEDERLRVATEQIRLLSNKLTDLPEQERRRMAHALHDEIGQSLTSIKLALEAGIAQTQGAARDRLSGALATTRDIMKSVTQIAQDLRPAMLDELGLLPALLRLVDQHRLLTGLAASLRHSGLGSRINPEVETAAYRIVQEALNNVSRHAGVSGAAVTMRLTNEALTIKIEDRGAGFDEAVMAVNHWGGGLMGMLERARGLGGHLSIDTELGRGTTISVELPLGPPRPAAAAEEQ